MMPMDPKRPLGAMLSIPHLIIVFIVALVVFGPQKLPELARTLGKLMAEFRKASGDFKSAFETEMRDLERQAMLAERKNQAEVAAGSAAAEPTPAEPASQGTPPGTETPAIEYTDDGVPIDTRQTEASAIAEPAVTGPVIPPVPESVRRSNKKPPP